MTQASTSPDGGVWFLEGACRNFGGELFFSKDEMEIELAKSICRICPVSDRCLAQIQIEPQPWGVWAGYSAAERKAAVELVPLARWPRKRAEQAQRFLGAMCELSIQINRLPSLAMGFEVMEQNKGKGWRSLYTRIFRNWKTVKRILSLLLLRQICEDLGRVPLGRELDKIKYAGSKDTLALLFGTPARAVELSGDGKGRRATVRTQAQLLSDFRRLCREHDRLITCTEIDRWAAAGECAGHKTYYKHFGGYDGLVAAAYPDGVPW